MKKIPIYAGDAADTSGPDFGLAVLRTDMQEDLIIRYYIKRVKSDKTYDIWINQYPDIQSQPKQTTSKVLTTNAKGRGHVSIRTARIAGATDLWISVTSDDEYLRSAAVALS